MPAGAATGNAGMTKERSRCGAGDVDPSPRLHLPENGCAVQGKEEGGGASSGKRHRFGETCRRPSECDGIPGRTTCLTGGNVAISAYARHPGERGRPTNK